MSYPKVEDKFNTIVANGACSDIRAFLQDLSKAECKRLFSDVTVTLVPRFVSNCIENLDIERIQLLTEYGAQVTDADMSAAISAAVNYRSTAILDCVFDVVRKQGTFDSALNAATTPKIDPANQYTTTCVNDVLAADDATVLTILLDAGMSVDGCVTADNNGERRLHTVVHAAAMANAVGCMRMLEKRLPKTKWHSMLLQKHPFFSESALDIAFLCRAVDVFEYLLSIEGPDTDLDLLPQADERKRAEDALVGQILASRAAASDADTKKARKRKSLSSSRTPREAMIYGSMEETAPAVSALFAEWDRATCAEMYLALAAAARTPKGPLREFVIGCGWARATTGILRAGLTVLGAPHSKGALILAARTPGAEEAAFRGAWEELSYKKDLSEDDAKAALVAHLDAGDAFSSQLIARGRFTALRMFLKAGGRLEPSALAKLAGFRSEESIAALRPALEALKVDGGLPDGLKPSSFELLNAALSSGNLFAAQLFAENGADVFATNGSATLFSGLYKSVAGNDMPRRLLSASMLPAAADPAVEAARASRVAGALDAAGFAAHVAAAAAEEERLLAAVLEDPLYLTRDKSPLLLPWAASVMPTLAARWLWKRMCDINPTRARQYLCGDSGDSDLRFTAALKGPVAARDSRGVMFMCACGASLGDWVKVLDLACRKRQFEFVWAVAHGAIQGGLELPKSGAIIGVMYAATKGFPVPSGICAGLKAAGAFSAVEVITEALTDRRMPVTVAEYIRLALEIVRTTPCGTTQPPFSARPLC
jgi:hypothetical protein